MALVLKDKAAASVTFAEFRQEGNRAEYVGPNHTDLDKQTVILSSEAPKQNGVTYGNRRSVAKVIDTVTVAAPTGADVRRDMKLELSASIPVGATFAEFEELAANVAEMLAQPTLLNDLFMIGKIDH
nr:MAG: hypothetical protein 2 [Leviviridae sp.]